jgi:organic hydroperoxide reductase OsmC/OhrA
MAEQETIKVCNGIDMDALWTTINAVKDEPVLGKSEFRIHNKWLKGGQNKTTVSDFYAAGQENPHKDPFLLEADEPELVAGQDQAANPVEYLLHALAACLTSTMVYHAATQGIEIEELESRLEGELDMNGFLGLSARVRLKELAEFSPVLDVVSHGTPVDLKVESM